MVGWAQMSQEILLHAGLRWHEDCTLRAHRQPIDGHCIHPYGFGETAGWTRFCSCAKWQWRSASGRHRHASALSPNAGLHGKKRYSARVMKEFQELKRLDVRVLEHRRIERRLADTGMPRQPGEQRIVYIL